MKQLFTHKKWIVIAVSAVLVFVAGLLIFLLAPHTKEATTDDTSSSKNSSPQAEEIFYRTIENAAKQQQVAVSMYRETFANAADADAHKNVGTIASSVSEVDTKTGKYSSVFAHNLLQSDKSFSIGRCVNNVTYYENFTKTERPKNLDNIEKYLQVNTEGNLYKLDQPLRNIACPYLGLLPASPPLPVARLSDGLIPVTLSETQAKNYTKELKAASFFVVEDKGTETYNGKKVRKIAFTPKQDQNLKINEKLYDIFYKTGEIEKIKAEHPDAQWQYEFLTMNPANAGGIGGYYLIDEATQLPVYSQLYSTYRDTEYDGTNRTAALVARTKQEYRFGQALSITTQTPLTFTK